MKELEAKKLVAAAGLRLLHEGLVARTWGNVSCRVDADSYVITPSGMSYEAMQPEDVVPFSMQSDSWCGAHKPSSEKGVHTAAYQRFADAGFVIHTHQNYGTALGLAGFETLALSPEDRAALGGVALAAYGLPGTPELTQHVADAMAGGAHTILMAHHGCLFVGKTPDEAFARAEKLEEICRAACLGMPKTTADFGPIESLQATLKHPGVLAFTAHPAVRAMADAAQPLTAQIDDMAMMIGATLPIVENAPDAVAAALETSNVVLVRGAGAVVCGKTDSDAEALILLTEKACIAALHAAALGVDATLDAKDIEKMHRLYIEAYSKQYAGKEDARQ